MNYREALAWLYATQLHGIKLGLENTRRLLDALGWHGRGQRFIHVAGTNGKGSVCAMLDAICRAQKIRTGLFTSPHLVSFRERIRIDGEMISENAVADGLTRIREIVSNWEPHPTFFEITTALALEHFQRERADVVVLETGMGGRLDATNAVTPLVSVITAIDFDHQAFLGSTLREIAAEKAGIIKPRVPVVSAPQHADAAEALERTAVKQNAKLLFIAAPMEKYPVGLPGSHQELHAAIAAAALREAKIEVPESALRDGLQNVRWPGRFQKISERFILDGAHNPAAAARLAQTWREEFGEEKVTVILGVLQDKDLDGICAALTPIARTFIATPVQNPRTRSATELASHISRCAASCATAENLQQAITTVHAQPGRILITGSLFLIGEALALLGESEDASPEISSQ